MKNRNYQGYLLPGGFPHPEAADGTSRGRCGLWMTADGVSIHVSQMEDSHLLSVFRLSARRAKARTDKIAPFDVNSLPGGAFTGYDIEELDECGWTDRDLILLRVFNAMAIVPPLVMEVFRRGLMNHLSQDAQDLISPDINTDAWDEYRVRNDLRTTRQWVERLTAMSDDEQV